MKRADYPHRARGKALDAIAATLGAVRIRKFSRRWWTLWLWLHPETDDQLRARLAKAWHL